MAAIGWIDFSDKDRSRIGSVLDLLRPEGMVDELGFGTLRDALANKLFPGISISTIQTKAKYFFIIPYILLDYQALKPAQRKGKTAIKYLEDIEDEIMWYLAEQYNYTEGYGVIGITKRRGHKIVRRPSAIYWNGLYTYQFINTKGLSADSFLKQATNSSIESLISVQQGDDSTGDDADAEYENMFSIRVPRLMNWKENLTLDLHKEEAEFFRDRIVSIAANNLLAALLQNEKLWKILKQSDSFNTFVKAAMSLPLSESLQSMLVLAHDFSELMYGAHLAYNCQLQKKVFNNSVYEEKWDKWVNGLPHNMLGYSTFRPDVLLSFTKTTRPTTERFVQDWWAQAQKGFHDSNDRNNLIQQQEAFVKGSKARLRWHKTDDVKEGAWHGLQYFEYRFFQARTILDDIRKGL
jgi:hypothetical protein